MLKNKVYFYLFAEELYEDGTVEFIKSTKYEGKKRYEAIKAFEDLKKQFPSYEYIKKLTNINGKNKSSKAVGDKLTKTHGSRTNYKYLT